MDTMATTEKENIKKLHAELPPHLQSVVSVDGDTIGITDGEFWGRSVLIDKLVWL